MKIGSKILLSRLLTRSGDQAWDFAVPIVLINTFPNQTRFSLFYYFAMKLGTILLMPKVGRIIDYKSRKNSLILGIALQSLAVLFSVICIVLLKESWNDLTYLILILLGIASAIGSNVMDIAVANDLVPTIIPSDDLSAFNSRMRQLDLLTEVLSPVIAGSLILISPKGYELFGFGLVAFWNLISFCPEYLLLNNVLNQFPSLNHKNAVPINTKLGMIQKIKLGWVDFKKISVSKVIIVYSLLWLSALSPHGVLLTAFLKGGWHLSEPLIGFFRGLGAVFGLIATLTYPFVRKKLKLAETAKVFLFFQGIFVSLAFVFFLEGSEYSQYLFLGSVLLSRIGLYGFSLGEMELRQILIPKEVRGEVNGVGSALNSLATLVLFALGLVFATPDRFKFLVGFSWMAVVTAFFYYLLVLRSKNLTEV